MAGGKNLWKLCLIVTGIIITQFASAQDTVKTKCVFHASGEEWLVREDVIGFVSPPFRRFAIQSDIVKKTELA
ncbi:MAG TPA: hypothetical protein VNJ07_14280, partial [Chitinophagales bacterium]|nr:hypothetical protein [Chitinophagales bacterium]